MKASSLLLGDLSEQQLQHKHNLMKVLGRYLPAPAVEYCSELIMLYKLHLHIDVERHDRLGDYSPHLGRGNRISINHNLNPYDFLVTFVHELAHHVAYKKHGPAHQAHGAEWKQAFKDCMRPVVMMKMFPPDIEAPLIRHMRSPRYTHSGDIELMKALMKYDRDPYHTLDQLDEGALFKLKKKGRIVLQKGASQKKYFICEDINRPGVKYKVFGIAKVIPLNLAAPRQK